MSSDPDDFNLSYLKGAEFWAVVARGNLGFRFGPYTSDEIGPIMEQAGRERCPVVVTATCGREFDWELAREMRGWPADYHPMENAPRDGTIIIGDLNGIEAGVRWSMEMQSWRLVEDDGGSGEAVTPGRWRHAEAGEL